MQFFVNGAPVCGDVLPLGVQGEALTTTVTADVSDWLEQWPDGQVIAQVISPGQTQTRIANTVVQEGVLTWLVTSEDTVTPGFGAGVVKLIQGQQVKKSAPFITQVVGETNDESSAQETVPGWVDEAIRQMQQLELDTDLSAQAAQAAQTAAEAARDAAQTAQTAAETASGSASGSAQTAQTAAAAAGESADAAQTYKTAAETAAQAAETASGSASGSAQTAQTAAAAAGAAAESAQTAQTAAEAAQADAAASAAQAAQSATDAQTAAASAAQAVAGAVKYSEAQTLSAAQQAQARANIGAGDADAEEVADLKSALNGVQDGEIDGYRHIEDWVNGTWNGTSNPTPTLDSNNKRIRPNGFVNVKAGDVVSIDPGENYKQVYSVWKGNLGSAVNVTSSQTFSADAITLNINYDGFFIVVFANATDQSTVANPSLFDGSVTITSYARRELLKEINNTKNDILIVDGALKADEKYIGVHRSDPVKSTNKVSFSVPQYATLDIYTIDGSNLPSCYFYLYDSNNTQLDYFSLSSTYGNKRTIRYTKADASYVAISVSYTSGIRAVWYEENSNNKRNSEVVNADYKSLLTKTAPVNLGNYEIGAVVDISPIYSSGNNHYTMLLSGVKEGEKFNINAVDGSTARPWAFLDSTYHLLDMAYNAYAENVEIEAPQNTEYLIVQVGTAASQYYDNAYIIRQESLEFLANGKKIGINQLNDPIEVENLLENATTIANGDSATSPKNRSNMFSLLHFSDIHGDDVDIERIIDFNKLHSKYICDIIHTGDSSNNYYADTNPFSLVGGDQVLNVVGNHDCWIQGANPPYSATAQQVYEKYFAPYISSWSVTSPGANLCYYYKDYATAKVRLIVLDCMHYDSTQESWFASVLGSVPSGYRVVAVTHYPSETGLTNIDCTFGSFNATLPTSTERMPESAFTAVDTFITGGGEFVCWLSGHTHTDYIGTVTGHSNQIQIMISTANPAKNDSSSARTKGTKSQDLFNVFVVDGTNKLLKLVRIGADKDKYMRSVKTLCLNYQTKEVISNE